MSADRVLRLGHWELLTLDVTGARAPGAAVPLSCLTCAGGTRVPDWLKLMGLL